MSSPDAPAVAGEPSGMVSQPALTVLVLSLLLGIQPVTTDLYLPALPALTAGFGAPAWRRRSSRSPRCCWPSALRNWCWGPLSDRFGRRPVLLVGLGAYTLAAIGCALAPSMTLLIVWRTLQGAAMGAAVMCARAIVRDLYAPGRRRPRDVRALTGLGVIACLCAPLGGAAVRPVRLARRAAALGGVRRRARWRWWRCASRRRCRAATRRAARRARWSRTWWTHRCATRPSWPIRRSSTASYGGLFTFLPSSSFVFIQVLGLSQDAVRPGDVLESFGLHRGHLPVPAPAAALRRAPHGGAWPAALTLAGGTRDGRAGAGRRAATLGDRCVPLLAVHAGARRAPALRPERRGRPVPAGGRRGLGAERLPDDAGGLRHRRLARRAAWTARVLPLANGIWFWSACIAAVAWTLVQRHGEPDVHGSRRHRNPAAVPGAGRPDRQRQDRRRAGDRASACRCEIISVDSALVYRGMDIGTAKPTRGRTRRGAAPPDRHPRPAASAYSAAEFVRRCHARSSREIRARGTLPLLVGGTMLYFKALIDGLDAMPRGRRGRARRASKPRPPQRGWPALHAATGRGRPGHRRAAGAERQPAHPARAGGAGASAAGRCRASIALRPKLRAQAATAPAPLFSLEPQRPRLAARAHRAALRRHAGRRLSRRGDAPARARRPARPTCRRCAASATARPGSTRSTAGTDAPHRPNCASAASPPRASSPSASSPGCAACPARTVVACDAPDAIAQVVRRVIGGIA